MNLGDVTFKDEFFILLKLTGTAQDVRFVRFDGLDIARNESAYFLLHNQRNT